MRNGTRTPPRSSHSATFCTHWSVAAATNSSDGPIARSTWPATARPPVSRRPRSAASGLAAGGHPREATAAYDELADQRSPRRPSSAGHHGQGLVTAEPRRASTAPAAVWRVRSRWRGLAARPDHAVGARLAVPGPVPDRRLGPGAAHRRGRQRPCRGPAASCFDAATAVDRRRSACAARELGRRRLGGTGRGRGPPATTK